RVSHAPSCVAIRLPTPSSTLFPYTTLFRSTLAAGTYTIGSPSTATVNILDNDTTVTIAATDPSAAEAGPDTGTFTVTRNNAAALIRSANFSASVTSPSRMPSSAIATNVTIP